MSGIIGIINLDGSPVDRLLLGRMTDYMAFRGPDAQETWSQGPVGLGHTLLRTVDDTRADSQPLTLDGRVWIVADARVDGRIELRSKLRNHGCHDLEEATDAELILQSYLVWGEECVQHLIGDFAFAIWDEPRQRLFGARDQFGVKPFFYARVGNCLVFSNTLNCLRMHPEVSDKLNDLAIADFLLFDFNQDPATTTFADIQRVPPAHCLTWASGELRLRRYWDLPQEGPLRYARPQDYVDHFKDLLTQAVADRLRTRSVGVFMTGGLDSSSVAATAKNILQANPDPYDLRAYTGVYDHLIPDNERYFSGLVATHLAIPIHYHVEDDYEIYAKASQPETQGPEPYHYPQVASGIDLLWKVMEHSRVILTGHGGDPICIPSQSYFLGLLKRLDLGQLIREVGQCVWKYRRLPRIGFRSSLRRLFRETPSPYPPWLNQAFATRLNLPKRWAHLNQTIKVVHPVREEACRIFLDPLWAHLFEQEWDAGATGLPVEFRHPLFDTRIVSYALSLPPIPWCSDKMLLREAGRGLLPEAVRCRPKTPLATCPNRELAGQPEAKWLDRLEPVADLLAFVDCEAIAPVAGENDILKLWTNLRPRSLNYWLADQSRRKDN
jgi:asparagine synthase (glutamine-hydrolysing)